MIRFILLLLLFLFLARAAWRLFEGIVQGALEGRQDRRGGIQPGVKMVRDPVCGTYVIPGRALTTTRAGETFYFCSDKCRDQFRRKP